MVVVVVVVDVVFGLDVGGALVGNRFCHSFSCFAHSTYLLHLLPLHLQTTYGKAALNSGIPSNAALASAFFPVSRTQVFVSSPPKTASS